MGLFSSLFKKKDNAKVEVAFTEEIKKEPPTISQTLHLKGVPDANGLYPSELVMLSYAEKYTTNETNFPAYLSYTYEIANPPKMLKNLASRGFIEVGSAKDALHGFKLAELKEIAASLGIIPKGKKADIIVQLSAVDDALIAQFVKERAWKLTESGKAALNANPYIQYFLDKHPYNITEVGVDIWTVNKEFVKNPKRPYRDVIFRQLNHQMNKASIAFQTNPYSGTADTHTYCECYRLMGLFIEEEGKSYINASDYYFQYLFIRINIHAGMQLILRYKLSENKKEKQDEAIEHYYDDIQLYPFHRTELLRLIDELGIGGDAVREALITSFKRTRDTGIMTEEEAANFIIFELNGEGDKSRELAVISAKKAVKKIR